MENNELVQRTPESVMQNIEKRKEKIKSEVCTSGMSQAACNKAIAAEFDRNNAEFGKMLIDLATLVPGISEADALSILLNEKTLSGDEASRIWGAIGIITAGYGQKLRLAGKELLALNSAEELVTSTGHVIKNAEANAIKSESRGVGKEAGKEAAKAGKETITAKTPDGISFNINQPKHLATVDGFSQKAGISGGHNADAFHTAAKQNGVKILSETPTNIPGIIKIEYQIPAKDRTGNFTGDYKGNGSRPFEKTVYDPKIFTDQKILDLGQKAAIKGYTDAMASKSGQTSAIVDGVKFRIYVDKTTGTIRNFHPE
ncbi:CdiA family toxin C-terminal domain-containing protein [Snodgrassella communis]|nr:CdiA family toxin C-terminal domain-containing protein [Snodgrassella communis]